MRKDITGQRYGKLIAVKPSGKKERKIVWEFKCDCGNICYKTLCQLTKTSNCGCNTYKLKQKNGLNSIENIKCVLNTNVNRIRSNKLSKNNTSGVRGVSWDKYSNTWSAYINFQKITYRLGNYKKLEDAIKVRKQAEGMLFEPFLEWYEEMKTNKEKDGK